MPITLCVSAVYIGDDSSDGKVTETCSFTVFVHFANSEFTKLGVI